MPVRERKAVHLRLDAFHLDAKELLQVLHGDLVAEAAAVAHDLAHALLNGHHLGALHVEDHRADMVGAGGG